MELTFIQQSTAFLYSLILGLGIGVFYGLLKIVRTAFCPQKVTIFILDFIFMIAAALAIFIFSIAYMFGYVRIFTIIGVIIGFFAYRLSLGRLFSKVYCPVIKFIGSVINKILLKIKNFTKKLLKIAYKILYNICNNRCIFRNRREKLKNKEDSYKNEKSKGT